MTTAFQPTGFQNNAFQIDEDQIAFQPCAFQADAFQTIPCPTPTPDTPQGGAGHPWSAYVSPTGRVKRKARIDDFLNREMRALYEDVIEVPELREKAVKIVKPYVDKKKRSLQVPNSVYIDWERLEQDTLRTMALMSLWRLLLIELDDEEALSLLL